MRLFTTFFYCSFFARIGGKIMFHHIIGQRDLVDFAIGESASSKKFLGFHLFLSFALLRSYTKCIHSIDILLLILLSMLAIPTQGKPLLFSSLLQLVSVRLEFFQRNHQSPSSLFSSKWMTYWVQVQEIFVKSRSHKFQRKVC